MRKRVSDVMREQAAALPEGSEGRSFLERLAADLDRQREERARAPGADAEAEARRAQAAAEARAREAYNGALERLREAEAAAERRGDHQPEVEAAGILAVERARQAVVTAGRAAERVLRRRMADEEWRRGFPPVPGPV